MINKPNENLCTRAINFDLNTRLLKKYYPSQSIWGYKNAYKDIKNFLQENGFKHRQWSGYISNEPLTDYQIADVISRLSLRFSWLSKCVNQFDVTNISGMHSMIDIIKQKSLENRQKQTIKIHSLSLDERLAQAQEKANQRNKTISEPTPQSRNKDADIEIN
jgi:virulence-associated protein VapD